MAKRRPTAAGDARAKRRRRSAEEIIADLQRKIDDVRRRQEAQRVKRSAAVRATLVALRGLDKGLAAAQHERDEALGQALERAREPLATLLAERGIQLARARRGKSRRAT